MFSQASVILSTGAGACMAGGCALQGGVHGGWHAWPGGTCVAGGVCGMCTRGHVWQGGHVAGGVHGWGHVWQEGVHGRGHAWQGACVAGETTTAADGTHPTEMYSCFC